MTNGVTGPSSPDEPTRPLGGEPARPVDDAEWFWTREASEATAPPADEPTRVIPVGEPTQVLGAVEDTRVLPVGDQQAPAEPTVQLPLAMSAAIGSAAALAAHPTQSVPPMQPAPGEQGPWAPPAGQPWAAPAQPRSARRSGNGKVVAAVFVASLLTGVAVMPALSRTAGQVLPGGPATAQPAPDRTAPDGEQGQGAPAEEQPWDPWEESSDGATNEQSAGSTSSQTTPTSAQRKGVVLIQASTASGRSAGSGMVVTDDGYVLTNYHVVQSSTALQVKVATTQRSHAATVVGYDASNDVALLKLEGASGLDTVTLDDDELSTGDDVTAVGNANGQGFLSAASGRVTDLASSITVSNETSASGKERLTDVIKTTAGAQPGDSGGPMFDDEGEVVGMTTAGQQASSGIRTQNSTIASYAVPIERAMGIIDQIRAGKESGTVRIGPKAYLGVSVRTLPDGSIGVASVVDGGPAASAGLTRGDVVTSLDGTTITSHAELSDVLAGKEPGDTVTMTWLDQTGARQSADVTLGSSPMN